VFCRKEFESFLSLLIHYYTNYSLEILVKTEPITKIKQFKSRESDPAKFLPKIYILDRAKVSRLSNAIWNKQQLDAENEKEFELRVPKFSSANFQTFMQQ
jgi:hypothetical protein